MCLITALKIFFMFTSYLVNVEDHLLNLDRYIRGDLRCGNPAKEWRHELQRYTLKQKQFFLSILVWLIEKSLKSKEYMFYHESCFLSKLSSVAMSLLGIMMLRS